MKQNKLFSGYHSKAKAFLMVAVMSLSGLSAWSQTPTRVGVTGISEVNTFFTQKVYDGNTLLPMNPAATITLTGVAEGDDVTATAVGNYSSPNAGDSISFSISFSLSGADAANYYIDTVVTGLNGRITPKNLSVTATMVRSSKVYDGTTLCSVINNGTVMGAIPGDFFNFTANAVYLDPNVGSFKQVAVSYTLSGLNAGNYNPPANDSSFFADITPRPVHIVGVAIDSAKIYDGTTNVIVVNHGVPVSSEVVATDTIMPVTATALYLDPNVGDDIPVVITYQLGGPQASNYDPLPDSSMVADIVRRPLSAEGARVRLCKEYDATTAATLLQGANATNLVAGDIVTLTTLAEYDTPDTGHNKTIFLTFAFADNSATQRNYSLPDTIVYSHVGKIILPTELAILSTTSGEFALTTDGACMGDIAEANYRVTQGEPVVYYISFTPEFQALGFSNVDSVALPGTGEGTFLPIQIPSNCPFGHYYADITFLNEAEVSVTYRFPFTVNYSSDYMTAIFEDVVSIVNTEEIFSTYQWYHNGLPIEGATLPYYQEEGGLTGTYFVRVNIGTPTEGRTCDKSFNTRAATKSVKVSPNPVSTTAKVSLRGFDEGAHLLEVFNAYGQKTLSCTFSGNECLVDLSAMPQGAYLVTVDGEKAKAIKF